MNALRRLFRRIRRPLYRRRLRTSLQHRTLGPFYCSHPVSVGDENILETVQTFVANKPSESDVYLNIQKPNSFYRSIAITVGEDQVFETVQLIDTDRDFTGEVHMTDSFVRYCHQTVGQQLIFEAVRPMAADRSVNAEFHRAEETSCLHFPHYLTTESYVGMTQRMPLYGLFDFFGEMMDNDHQKVRVAQLCSSHDSRVCLYPVDASKPRIKRALKARLGTSQSPPLRLHFRSLELDQFEALEASRVSTFDSTNLNTSETTLPVPDSDDTWSASTLAGPFPTEVCTGDTNIVAIPDMARTYKVSKPEQAGDENDDTLDALSQMSNDMNPEPYPESGRWAWLNEEIFNDEFSEMDEADGSARAAVGVQPLPHLARNVASVHSTFLRSPTVIAVGDCDSLHRRRWSRVSEGEGEDITGAFGDAPTTRHCPHPPLPKVRQRSVRRMKRGRLRRWFDALVSCCVAVGDKSEPG
ncbi:hypothetical protein SprV_0401404100 [Sparganum proliferum]